MKRRQEAQAEIEVRLFILMRRQAERGRTHAALQFFHWTLQRGAATAARLGYVPLPAKLVQQVSDYWAKNLGVTVDEWDAQLVNRW